MSLRTVCRVCLATDAPVHNIVDSPLRDVYEKLTDLTLTRPAVACFLCYSQLRKCHNLMVKSVRADKVLAQILCSGQQVKGESFAMLYHRTHRHALSITPIELIAVTATQNNLMEEEIKKEPLSPQCVEEREMDRAACDEHLKFEESEDEGGAETMLLEEVDIESPVLTDERHLKQEELEPLNISVSLKDMETEEMSDGRNMKSAGADNTNERKRKGEESKGAAPDEKCKKIHADKTQDGSTLTSHGKNILEKQRTSSTVIEEEMTSRNVGSYMLRSTKKSSNNRQITINTSMYCTAINKSNICVNTTCITRVHAGQKYFECEICKVRFIKKGDLKRHLRLHTGERPYECEICKVRFRENNHLKTHLRLHTGEKPYECEICKVRFTHNNSLKRHLRLHNGEKPYECEICQVRFRQNSQLKTHLRLHTGEKPYECEICKVRFRLNSHLKDHLKLHTGEKPYECETCKVRFIKKGDLKRHLRLHTGEKPYECEICKVRFRENGCLKTHLRLHTGEKPYECEICKLRFTHKNSLKRHLRLHTGEKPYQCEICNVGFSHSSHLKDHLRLHTGEKPYECEICKVRFRLNSHLKYHLKLHTGEKPYECEICKATFSRKGNLKIHLLTHTGQKPFKCEICKVRFSKNGNLKRHLILHTGEKPYECDTCQRRFTQKHHLSDHLRTHAGRNVNTNKSTAQ